MFVLENRPVTDWQNRTNEIKGVMRTLRGDAPEAMKAFTARGNASRWPKALDVKTKELIALGIALAIRCDDCIGFHVKAALDQGATRAEVTETLAMAVYMGAGPAVMYATHALDAFQQFSAADKPQSKAGA